MRVIFAMVLLSVGIVYSTQVPSRPIIKNCETCNWQISNSEIIFDDNTTQITVVIANEKSMYNIAINLTQCYDFTCHNYTEPIVQRVNCTSKNLTLLEQETCAEAKEVNNWNSSYWLNQLFSFPNWIFFPRFPWISLLGNVEESEELF